MDSTYIRHLADSAVYYLENYPDGSKDGGEAEIKRITAELHEINVHDLWSDEPSTEFQEEARLGTLHLLMEDLAKSCPPLKEREYDDTLLYTLSFEYGYLQLVLNNAFFGQDPYCRTLQKQGVDTAHIYAMMKKRTWRNVRDFCLRYYATEKIEGEGARYREKCKLIAKYIEGMGYKEGRNKKEIFDCIVKALKDNIEYDKQKYSDAIKVRL